MKKNRIIFWTTTVVFGLMMMLSALQMLFNPQLAADFVHLGFPGYFRIELALAKIIGVLVLIIPQVPVRMKEWAYAGFGIDLISASIAHLASADPIANVIFPVAVFAILIFSNLYLHRLNKPVSPGVI